MLFVFFFKQKTAYEMRISDWSSDVCSSDLFNRDQLSTHRSPPSAFAKASSTTSRMRVRFVMRGRPSVGGVSADGTPNGANGMRIGFGSVKPEPIMPTKSVETAKKAKLRSIRPCTRVDALMAASRSGADADTLAPV